MDEPHSSEGLESSGSSEGRDEASFSLGFKEDCFLARVAGFLVVGFRGEGVVMRS